jgi:DMSO/TMAO reductase YedYZ molybdopterin-dependent catalytic subunit
VAHGFPARLVIPGRYGMKGPKWLDELELAASEVNGYWEGQGWDRRAVVKTTARIDAPGDGSILGTEPARIAGVAFAGRRGVSRVEVSTDGGETWAEADLGKPLAEFAWRGWSYLWEAEPGEHELCCRATDAAGNVQPLVPEWNFDGYCNNAVQRVHVVVSDRS